MSILDRERALDRAEAIIEEYGRSVATQLSSLWSEADAALTAVRQLRDEHRRMAWDARRYYLADGTSVLLDSPEEVVRRRIEAAKKLLQLGEETDP
jgi:hypothetical protein